MENTNMMFVMHSEGMIMCLVLLLLLFALELSMRNDAHWKKYLPLAYVIVMVQLVIDTVWFLIDGNPNTIVIHKIIQTVYLSTYPILGYVWFEYCAAFLKTYSFLKNKWFHHALWVPILLNVVLTVLSWNNGFVYIVDEVGHYIRGPWILLTNGTAYTLMVSVALLSLVEALRTKDKTRRMQLFGNAFYILPTLVMGLMQALNVPGVTCVYFGFVISFSMMMIDALRFQITQDNTTGLLNRRTIEKKIEDALSRARQNDKICVVMADLDRFKSINDNFGHAEGDNALRSVARVLQSVCKKYDAHISRIHGDEFVFLLENMTEEEAEKMMHDVEMRLRRQSEESRYQMALSYGIAQYVYGMSMKGMYEIADKKLYDMKRTKYGDKTR